ncbi:MAG: NADH-quinone oxidoreductase subunit C [Bacteroidetes bacterium]|nr:NADH-quinone oxidoreductase subunit C [Bacteroidota bacterium]
MTNEALKAKIITMLPEAEVTIGKQYLEVVIPAEKLRQFARALKESEETSFDYLICLTGIDFPENMMVYYHLESYKHKHIMVLKTKTHDRQDPVLDTVCDIWRTAEFHEREVYDLLGVKFNGHPDLRRLFLDEGWGFPLRKDYMDEIRIVER